MWSRSCRKRVRIPCGRWTPIASKTFIVALRDIHFIAVTKAEDFQLGADLLFWHSYSQTLKNILRRDQYVPALRYHVLEAGHAGQDTPLRSTRAGISSLPAMRQNWRATPRPCPASAPPPRSRPTKACCTQGCRSCVTSPSVWSTRSYWRHLLRKPLPTSGRHAAVPVHIPLSATGYFRSGIARPCSSTMSGWAAWRAGFANSADAAGFTLCFRLVEAPADDPEHWELHFEVAATRDPSHLLALAEYWHLAASAQDRARRASAQPEHHLLLALGHAARIYPLLWSGMATDRPSACSLSLEQPLLSEGKRMGARRRRVSGDRACLVDA